jgi:Uma2 family endonuclease
MTVATFDFAETFKNLPPGAAINLHNIGWDEYEEILCKFEERPGYRLTYDKGKLEIMSPRYGHEEPKEFILSVMVILSMETGITVQAAGSTSLKRRRKMAGAEPGACFYVQNAARIIGKKVIDLNTDPPPDVAVEIDTTNDSWKKFPIYATLGVPEIWRYDGRQTQFYQLGGAEYRPVANSRAFPVLTPQVLTDFLAHSQREGQTAALRACRAWLLPKTK